MKILNKIEERERERELTEYWRVGYQLQGVLRNP
jgi:hypothetical protein